MLNVHILGQRSATVYNFSDCHADVFRIYIIKVALLTFFPISPLPFLRVALAPSVSGSSGCSSRAPPAGRRRSKRTRSKVPTVLGHGCICSTGGLAARQRSVARFTGWSTETAGAPPVAGRKPANALRTEAAAARCSSGLLHTHTQTRVFSPAFCQWSREGRSALSGRSPDSFTPLL